MRSKFKKTALIVGAGAVENAWSPILNIIEAASRTRINSDGANSFFSRMVYLLRFYSTGKYPDAKKHANDLLEYISDLKADICNALKYAEEHNQIKVRKEFNAILKKFVFSETDKSVLITTNWDTIIDKEINRLGKSNYPKEGSDIEILHLHGSISSPNDLYLPSEIVREPYRSEEDDIKMGRLHGTIWRTLAECNTSVLYGLSLDPLDAELCQTLAAGWSSPNLEEVIIINPDHKRVAQRAALLLDYRFKVNLIGYSPSNLYHKYDYTDLAPSYYTGKDFCDIPSS